jgi:hypothetical protein
MHQAGLEVDIEHGLWSIPGFKCSMDLVGIGNPVTKYRFKRKIHCSSSGQLGIEIVVRLSNIFSNPA